MLIGASKYLIPITNPLLVVVFTLQSTFQQKCMLDDTRKQLNSFRRRWCVVVTPAGKGLRVDNVEMTVVLAAEASSSLLPVLMRQNIIFVV